MYMYIGKHLDQDLYSSRIYIFHVDSAWNCARCKVEVMAIHCIYYDIYKVF